MQTRYVNTASSAGGDGTTNATSGANRAYASLSEWEAARQAVLSEVEECICEGATADSTGVTIDGWTTDASNYILIRTTQANRHSGKWDTSKFRVNCDRPYYAAVEVYEEYVRLEGLQARNSNSATWNTHGFQFRVNADGSVVASSCDQRAEACIAYDCQGGSHGFMAYGGRVRLINCVSYSNTNHGFAIGGEHWSGSYATEHTVYNCLAAANDGAGMHNDNGVSLTAVVRNCYCGGNTGADYSGSGYDTFSNNRSEDGTLSTPTSAYSTSSGAYFTNVTAGSQNFEIANASSALIDAGYDLSGTFTVDILGNTRSGTWEVGPFNYSSGGGATVYNRGIFGAPIFRSRILN